LTGDEARLIFIGMRGGVFVGLDNAVGIIGTFFPLSRITG
jgi:hypothetical protein